MSKEINEVVCVVVAMEKDKSIIMVDVYDTITKAVESLHDRGLTDKDITLTCEECQAVHPNGKVNYELHTCVYRRTSHD